MSEKNPKGKVEIEIQNGKLGDLLDIPKGKLAEGLINVLDPNPSCVDTWEVSARDFWTGRKFVVILRRVIEKKGKDSQ